MSNFVSNCLLHGDVVFIWDPKWDPKQFRKWSHLRSQCPKFSFGINVRRHFCSRTRAWWLAVSARRVGLLFQQYAYSRPIFPFRRFRGKREKEKFQRAMRHSHGWKWIYLVELAIFIARLFAAVTLVDTTWLANFCWERLGTSLLKAWHFTEAYTETLSVFMSVSACKNTLCPEIRTTP